MKRILPILSAVALLLVITPACLYLIGTIGKADMKSIMLAGTILWFASAPFWFGGNK